MSNIVPFNPAGPAAIPAEIAALFKNTAGAEALPFISIKGKVWKSNINGVEENFVNSEDEPIQTLKVVVLGETPGRSRSYFEGAYDPENVMAPKCHSFDGERPATDAKEPQAPNCRACPHSVKGSKVMPNGSTTTACSTGKRLAIIPSDDLNSEVFLLKLPITSVWEDKDSYADKNYFVWDSYKKFIKKFGFNNAAYLETSMRFDPKAEYPKIIFKASGQFPNDVLMKIGHRTNEDAVTHILGLDKVRETDYVAGEEEVEEVKSTPKQSNQKPVVNVVATKPTVVQDDLFDDDPKPTAPVEAAPTEVPKKPRKPRTPATPAPVTDLPDVKVIQEGQSIDTFSWDD